MKEALIVYTTIILHKNEVLILLEFGHTGDVWGFQPDALQHLLTSFYDTGEADDSLFTYQPMDFDAGPDFPSMAKLGVGAATAGAVTIAGAIALTVWLLVR